MADPVKSDEIEDVLSSIRRLVSEHHPTGAATPPVSEDADASLSGLSEKLVLTPALRVTDPEDPWVPITPREDADAADHPEAEASDDEDLPRGDGVDWAQELWGDDRSGPDPAFDPQLQADIWDTAECDGEADDSRDAGASDDGAPIGADPDIDKGALLSAGLADPPEADIVDAADIEEVDEPETDDAPDASHETAEAASHDTPEADDADAADTSPPVSFIRSSSSLVDYEPEEGAISPPDEAPPFATRELAEARAAQMAVAGVLSAVQAGKTTADASDGGGAEAAHAAPQDHAPEPSDAASQDAVEPSEPESAPTEELDAPDFLADPQPEADDTPSSDAQDQTNPEVEDLGEGPFSFPDDDAGFVDEATLREIIAEVVREELQGELGQRITRNVRKLVRREIRIALAADDLDD